MSYIFQTDVNDPSFILAIYRLQNVFKNANPDDPMQTREAVKHVLDDLNVVDYSVHPDSPRRNRPAYLVRGEPKEITIEHLPPKDWSKLGR